MVELPPSGRGMPSQHRHQPISLRLPEQLRDWVLAYASTHNRPVRSVVIEALEEYRAQRERKDGDTMHTVTSEHARNYLRIAFTHNFMRPDQPAWPTPIWFPGINYSADGTLSGDMKAKGTEHLLGVLRDHGYVIRMSAETDVRSALHHALWDQWTKEEAGNGRFTGRLFDDLGRIYQGCTALDAANYTVERLTVLGGELRSYTIQEDGPQSLSSPAKGQN